MSEIIRVTAEDGHSFEFVNKIVGSGAGKDVYFSPDKSRVVGFYHTEPDAAVMQHLETLIRLNRELMIQQEGEEDLLNLFCWPMSIVRWNGKVGFVVPALQKHFFFSENSRFAGKEKDAKWFASAKLRNKFLGDSDTGTWAGHVRMCMNLARAVRCLHECKLVHTDLSCHNLLADPETGSICIPNIVDMSLTQDEFCAPDWIAPETLNASSWDFSEKSCLHAQRHVLAVWIYMFLLNRHPLRGGWVRDIDPAVDEKLSMGSQALFIEHPTDIRNRPRVDLLDASELPQCDVSKRPYSLCGPYLATMFERAFIDGLHRPELRPTAKEWEDALRKTMDLLMPCTNPQCKEKWYLFDNKAKPNCPFCGKEYKGKLPILNFYRSVGEGKFTDEHARLVVYSGLSLDARYANRQDVACEECSRERKKTVGDFCFRDGKWILSNHGLPNMCDVTDPGNHKKIPAGGYVELREGAKILLDTEPGGRLVYVQLVSN